MSVAGCGSVRIFSIYDIQSEVLAASSRNSAQISEAVLAGVDILTVPSELLLKVADNPLSEEGMATFVAESRAFCGARNRSRAHERHAICARRT